jgi:hypothetical protein
MFLSFPGRETSGGLFTFLEIIRMCLSIRRSRLGGLLEFGGDLGGCPPLEALINGFASPLLQPERNRLGREIGHPLACFGAVHLEGAMHHAIDLQKFLVWHGWHSLSTKRKKNLS